MNPSASPPRTHNARQRVLRRRCRRLRLEQAVRIAVCGLFGFRYRARSRPALWCTACRVWLGPQTFLEWAFWAPEIDILWVVQGACDAPADKAELRKAAKAALLNDWEDNLAVLPCRDNPRWLPLP